VVSENSPKLLAGTGKMQVHLLVVANSDRGLCGAFNSNIVKAARLKAKALEAEGKTVAFYLIGRKGRAVSVANIPTRSSVALTPRPFAKQAMPKRTRSLPNWSRCTKRQVRRGAPVLQPFRSALLQEPTAAADHPRARSQVGSGRGSVVEYEPEEEEILAALLPRYLKHPDLRRAAGKCGQRTGRIDDRHG
jgi:F-type H+-transporting ATPase subunit gamma